MVVANFFIGINIGMQRATATMQVRQQKAEANTNPFRMDALNNQLAAVKECVTKTEECHASLASGERTNGQRPTLSEIYNSVPTKIGKDNGNVCAKSDGTVVRLQHEGDDRLCEVKGMVACAGKEHAGRDGGAKKTRRTRPVSFGCVGTPREMWTEGVAAVGSVYDVSSVRTVRSGFGDPHPPNTVHLLGLCRAAVGVQYPTRSQWHPSFW